jgi:hypothetical protein
MIYTRVYPKVSVLSRNEINYYYYYYYKHSLKPRQRVTAAKLTRLIHKIAIQLHLLAESCTICSARLGRPVRKLLDTLVFLKYKHSLRSNTKAYGGKTHYTDSQNSETTAPSGRELYHLQLSLQAASPETFGYTLVFMKTLKLTPRFASAHRVEISVHEMKCEV